MQKSLLAALVAAALIVPFAAQAEGTYVTLGVGQSDYSNLGPGFPAGRPTGFNLGVGFAIDKTWDVEVGYLHFGEYNVSTAAAGIPVRSKGDTQSIYAAAIGKVPVSETFSVFGKIGLAVHRSDVTDITPLGTEKASDTKVNYLLGGGVSYQFTKELTGLVDYTYFDKVNDSDTKLSLLSVGLRYAF